MKNLQVAYVKGTIEESKTFSFEQNNKQTILSFNAEIIKKKIVDFEKRNIKLQEQIEFNNNKIEELTKELKELEKEINKLN